MSSLTPPRSIPLECFSDIDYTKIVFPVFVIYEKPLDFPDKYVVRLWDCGRGKDPLPTAFVVVADTLVKAREKVPSQFTRIPEIGGDPCIVESYL